MQKKIETEEKSASEKKKNLQRRQFQQDKIAGISGVIFNTAKAILQAFAQLGPILGGVQTGIITAISGTQIAAIAARANPYNKGGLALTPQIATLAERGKPEAVLPPELTELLLRAAGRGERTPQTNIENILVVANDPCQTSR